MKVRSQQVVSQRSAQRLLPPLVVCLVTVCVALAIASLLDRPVWRAVSELPDSFIGGDWHRALRSMGFLPVWLVLSFAMALVNSQSTNGTHNLRLALRWPLLLSAAVLLAGGLGEILKVLIRRERPLLTEGEYVWRSFADRPFEGGELGMPSTHAVVAFAAAWMLCRMYPRAAPVWLALATGCAVTRVLDGAHFLSDTVLAAAVAFVVVRQLWIWSNHHPPGSAGQKVDGEPNVEQRHQVRAENATK